MRISDWSSDVCSSDLSVMLSDEDAAKRGDPRLLGVDNRMVVPAGKVVKLLVTADDVIHSWAMPSFWVKMDAVPGRINETWFKVDRPGVYYGQCSELCGPKHGFRSVERRGGKACVSM